MFHIYLVQIFLFYFLVFIENFISFSSTRTIYAHILTKWSVSMLATLAVFMWYDDKRQWNLLRLKEVKTNLSILCIAHNPGRGRTIFICKAPYIVTLAERSQNFIQFLMNLSLLSHTRVMVARPWQNIPKILTASVWFVAGRKNFWTKTINFKARSAYYQTPVNSQTYIKMLFSGEVE